MAAESAAHEHEQQLLELAENINETFWLMNADTFDIPYVSGAIRDIWQRSPEEIMAKPELWREVIHPEDRPNVTARLQDVINGSPATYEFRVILKSGEIRINESKVFPLRDKQGRVRRLAGITVDITDLHAREKALQQAKEHAEAASRAKSLFLSSLSHELRTPLNSILGFTDLLKGGFYGDLDQRQMEPVLQVERSGKHLLSLIVDLLDIARIEAGNMTMEYEAFPVENVIAAAVSAITATTGEDAARFQVEPSCTPLPLALGNPPRVKQVLISLLSNAIKYSPPEAPILISAQPSAASEEVLLSVSDSGMGIPEDKQEQLFSDFYQVDRKRDEHLGGAGIGLALCRRLVEMQGGKIGVTSHPLSGSVFWFTLPSITVPGETRPS